MGSHEGLSIRQRLTLNVLVTSLAAIVIAAGGFVTYESLTFERKMVRDMHDTVNEILHAMKAEIIPSANIIGALNSIEPP